MSLSEIKNYWLKWLLGLAIIFFILFLIFAIYLIFEAVYQNKIYPGLKLGNLNLAGKTAEQAKQLINQQVDKINQTGLTFFYKDQRLVIFPVIASIEGDLAYQLINFQVEQTASDALNFGRTNNPLIDLADKITALFFKKQINLIVSFNQPEIEKMLESKFKEFEVPAQEAKLIIQAKKYSPNYEITVSQEKIGKVIDYQTALNQLLFNLRRLNYPPIILTSKTAYPQIYQKDCLNIETKAISILNLAPITLKYQKQQWQIKQAELANLLALKNNPQTISANDKIIVGFDENLIKEFLQKNIAVQINRPPVDAKFEIKDGRVIEFQASQDGQELALAETFNQLEQAVANLKSHEVELVIKILNSPVNTENINNFGIKEIIGTGQSNFAGSPVNRRHNIKVGADALNGLLVKPAEEFSLLKALGKVDSSTGYLPELVIKENKTIPEYGGGLCQIGTTIFRATLASGLPVTMRRNHSYRVPYYEPAGTDATIYNPWPDFRFINEMKTYILIQTRIEGDNLYFDFWSTADDRQVEQTKPVIYNIVKPGPTKLIETLDLKPGVKKCTERAHYGADAYFDYKVTYPTGEIKEKKFSSHYVPWQEVCLIGVEKLSTDNQTATSTPTTNQDR